MEPTFLEILKGALDDSGSFSNTQVKFVCQAVSCHKELLRVAQHALDIFVNLGHGYSCEEDIRSIIAKAEGE